MSVRRLGFVPIVSPTKAQYKVLFYLPPFSRNSNVKLWPPIRPSVWRVRVDQGDRKWYQSKCHPHIPIRLLYTHWASLAPFGHNTPRGRHIQTDRQSDRKRPKNNKKAMTFILPERKDKWRLVEECVDEIHQNHIRVSLGKHICCEAEKKPTNKSNSG